MLKENLIGCSTVMISGDIAKQYRFATDFYHEDYCLWLNILRDGYSAVGCTEPLVDWRLIENSRSFDKRKAAGNRWRIYRDYLGFPLVKSLWLFACRYLQFRMEEEPEEQPEVTEEPTEESVEAPAEEAEPETEPAEQVPSDSTEVADPIPEETQ